AMQSPDPRADPTRHLEHGADRVDADHLPRGARRPGDKARGDPRAACDIDDRLAGPDVGRLDNAPRRGLADGGDEVLLVVLPGVSDVSLVRLGRRAHHDSFRIVGAPTLGRRGPTTQVGSPDQRAGGKPRRVRNPFTDCATKSMTADATA